MREMQLHFICALNMWKTFYEQRPKCVVNFYEIWYCAWGKIFPFYSDKRESCIRFAWITVLTFYIFDLQNKIILDPLTFSEARFRPSLEERLESIISGAALMADSSCTRDDRRERIVAECNAVRQALQDLLSEYMNNVSFSLIGLFSQLNCNCVHLCVRTCFAYIIENLCANKNRPYC